MKNDIATAKRATTGLMVLYACLDASAQVQSKECGKCHADIYKSYTQTGMSRTSGRVSGGLINDGSVTAAGASYRIKGADMVFERPDTQVKGARRLDFFLGSGGLGRSFIFSEDGFLFQAPVSYYAASRDWRLSPGYENKADIDLTRAIEPGCLQCHASGLRPLANTQNRFLDPPFEEAGVSCERCHGPAANHVRIGSASSIVNPRKLSPDRRDSVCAQCHLTGAARLVRTGAKPGSYRPGEKLSATLAVFVWSDSEQRPTATSHFEDLSRSACKKASGEKLWCGTCHNPHAEQSAASYRQRCMSCHQQRPCTGPGGDGCIGCHMPTGTGRAIEHVAFTDHSIPRRAAAQRAASTDSNLVPFWPEVDERDTALAYAVIGMTEPRLRREALLRLEKSAASPSADVAVLAQLAQIYDRMGREDKAEELYNRVLKLDPAHVAASVNLGTYRMKQGASEEALRLWTAALDKNPAQTGVGINIAVSLFRQGRLAEAEAALLRVLRYDPDSEIARKMLVQLRTKP